MNTEDKIPVGWYRLPKGTIPKVGDMWTPITSPMSPFKLFEEGKGTSFHPIGSNFDEIGIRRIARRVRLKA
jgi:hypothetical protein